jgi:hypothetical protein
MEILRPAGALSSAPIGFGKARGYVLVRKGQLYDSKAIAGVAHQYLPGRSHGIFLPLVTCETKRK